MDISEAALRLKKIEVIEQQIEHLRYEASRCEDLSDITQFDYAIACNEQAQELCLLLKEFWL